MVKDTMKRKKPSFNEEYHGYRTFSELLEDAQRHGLIEIEKHKVSGTYVVNRFGGELRRNGPIPVVTQLPPPVPLALPASKPFVPNPPPVRVERPPQRPQQSPPRPMSPVAPRVITPMVPKPQPRYESRADDDIPLGRNLIEEIDDLDDLDEIPSYAPKKAAVEPAAKPIASNPAKPAAAKPAAEPKKTREPAAVKPKVIEKPKVADRPKVIEKPKPKPLVEDDGFGSGLDD